MLNRSEWNGRLNSTLSLAMLLVVLAGGQLAGQTNLLVDRTDDGVTGNCDDGVPDDCPLRRAVMLAALDPGANVIQVPEGLFALTIPGDGEDLSATGDLDLYGRDSLVALPGARPIIEQLTGDRVLHVPEDGSTSPTVSIVGFVIRGGDVAGDGGGILFESLPSPVLNLGHSAEDAARGGGPPGLLLQDLEITDNRASGNGGGVTVLAAGANKPAVEVLDVVVRGNTAGLAAGGAFLLGHDVLVERSDFMANEARTSAGGLALSAIARLRDIRIHDNLVAGSLDPHGGGLVAYGEIVLERSSIVWNHVGDQAALSATGGGLSTVGGAETSVDLRNVTVAANSVHSSFRGAAPQIDVGSLTALDLYQVTVHDAVDAAIQVLGALRVEASIVDGGCTLQPGGSVISGGYSVERPAAGVASTCALAPGLADLVVSDVELAPPAVLGGPHGVLTMAPSMTSPARLHVSSTACLIEDARTAPRALLFCDAGAHESSASAPGPWIFADGFESGNSAAWSAVSN